MKIKYPNRIEIREESPKRELYKSPKYTKISIYEKHEFNKLTHNKIKVKLSKRFS